MTAIDNYNWFVQNLNNFLKDHTEEFVVIKDCKVLGFYKNFDEAYNNSVRENELGTFIIQQCIPQDDNTVTFYSPIAW